MKKPPPVAGVKASRRNTTTGQDKPSLPLPQALRDIDSVPHIRDVPSTDKNDVRCLWLSMARQGIILPRPPGIIIMRGGRA